MDFIWNSITDWLKEVLVSGIVSNLSGMFDSTNAQIGEIAGQVGMTPQAWNSGIFNMMCFRPIPSPRNIIAASRRWTISRKKAWSAACPWASTRLRFNGD